MLINRYHWTCTHGPADCRIKFGNQYDNVSAYIVKFVVVLFFFVLVVVFSFFVLFLHDFTR